MIKKIKRKTIQRRFISEVFDAGKEWHISAERMFEIVSKKHPMVGRATIYRNLAAMAEDGLLQRLEVPGGPDCFDTVLTEHYHVRCKACRCVCDMDMEHIERDDIDKKICDKRGFEIEGYVLAFRGICPKCQERRRKVAASAKGEAPRDFETTTVAFVETVSA